MQQRYEFAVLHWQSKPDGSHGDCTFSHRPAWEHLNCPLAAVLRRLGDDGFALVGAVTESPPSLYFQRPLPTH